EESQDEIERSFGHALEWDRGEERVQSAIYLNLNEGGYRCDQERWPAIQKGMIDTMCRLEAAFRPYIDQLKG
ncbi:MAG TPA: DUF4268 domain-containing protein, partial [bacterium]|nr:DUF4268 domain-containing protein [bacterium]